MSGYCQEYHIKLLYEVNTGPSSLYKLAWTRAPVFLINAWVSAPGQPYLHPAPQLLSSGSPAWEPLCWWLIKAPDVPCRVWEGRNKSHFQVCSSLNMDHSQEALGRCCLGCGWSSHAAPMGRHSCARCQLQPSQGLWVTAKGVSSPSTEQSFSKCQAGIFTALPTLEISSSPEDPG